MFEISERKVVCFRVLLEDARANKDLLVTSAGFVELGSSQDHVRISASTVFGVNVITSYCFLCGGKHLRVRSDIASSLVVQNVVRVRSLECLVGSGLFAQYPKPLLVHQVDEAPPFVHPKRSNIVEFPHRRRMVRVSEADH